MKISKRLFSMLVVIALCLTSFAVIPVSAAFTDLPEEHSAYEAVNVLSKLGVINGYEENGSFNFKPDNNVTRAEFTAMLLRTRGLGQTGSMSLENPPFPDVVTPDVSWAIGNIRTAQAMKIINGYDDGSFKPNNNVLYEEAIKMIVCALGYGEMGSEGAAWYSKYLMTAVQLKFVEGAGGAIGTPATRATIAQMLYNCLEIKLAENNQITEKTILENDLKLTKTVGYISSSPSISLSKPDANLRADEVEITVNGVASTYKVDDASKYNNMLGAQIEFYYQNDFNSGFKNLLLATVKNSTTIKIDASLIQSANAAGITYYKDAESERELTAGIATDSVVVYNGKLYGTANDATSTFATYYANEVIPEMGSIELLDRDGDNSYDVVFVTDYQVFFVSSVTTSDYKVTDNALRKGLSSSENQIVLNYKSDNIEFYTPDGAATAFNAIKKGSIIFVARSKHASGVTKVTVCNNTVSGKITATSSSKGFTINGKNYKESALAPWKKTIGSATPELTTAPQMGDTAKFYLDVEGNIIWYDKTEAASNQQYGYVIDALYKNGDFEEVAQVMIATKSNVKGATYKITTRSKLNGSTEALSDYITKLDKCSDRSNTADDDYKQLVKFTISNGTDIDEIITAEETNTGNDIKSDDLYIYKPSTINSGASLSYSKTSNELGGDVYIGSATFIINVSDPNKYSIMKLSDFKHSSTYNVEVFDVTTTDSAKAVVVYGGSTAIGELTGKAPVVLVNEIEKSGDNYIIYDKAGNSYVLSYEDSTTNVVAEGISQGDVVRLGGNEGEYTLKATSGNSAGNIHGYVIASLTSTSAGLYESENNETGSVDYRAVWGSVYKQYDGDRLIISKSVLSGWDGTGERPTVTPQEFAIKKDCFASAKIYKYTPGNNTPIEDITGDGYEAILGGLVHYNEAGDTISRPSEIFIHMTGAEKVNMMIIIER